MFLQLKKELKEIPPLSSPGKVNMSDLIAFPDGIRKMLNWMVRQKVVQVATVINFLGEDESSAQELIDELVNKGLVEEIITDQGPQYQVTIHSTKKYRVPDKIWKVIDE
jgi:hypothetical protein